MASREYFLGGMARRKISPREPRCQNVVTNTPTLCSTLGVFEGPLGDTLFFM